LAGKIFAFLMILAVVYMLCDLMRKEIPNPEKKEEYSGQENDTIDSEKKYTAEEVEKLMQDFENQKNTLYGQIGRLEMEVRWFEETCEKHIGGDWKEKTGYANRKM